ncbi:hypothetical protein [Haloferax sp. Q22]|uniref:hypothetical protein n=1 Tax=Haloferax sp. (strain Q22) TaxID=1526048 RepID=UPI00155E9FCD|nr:hypothetical protein [Haloferax sp. Q22]
MILYAYSLSRGAVDIILLQTIILLLIVSLRNKKYNLMAVTVGSGGIIIWTLHQSVYPFLVILLCSLTIFNWTDSGKRQFPITVAALTVPITIFPEPFRVYVSSAIAVSRALLDPTTGISLYGSNLDAVEMVVSSPPSLPPAWLGPIIYVNLSICTGLLIVTWAIIRHFKPESILTQLSEHRTQVTIAVAIATGGTAILYIIRGFTFRAFVFWPIVFPVFLNDLWYVSKRVDDIAFPIPNVDRLRTIFIVLLIAVAVTNSIPLLYPNYVDNQPNVVSNPQYSSAVFADNMNDDIPIYTDLLHSNAILIETDHRSLRNPRIVASINGEPGLDQIGKTLYNPECGPHRYHIISSNSQYGTTTWGGNIPSIDSESYIGSDIIYDNRYDSIHLFYKCKSS